MYSSADGYFNNVATALPGTGAVTPYDKHGPDSTKYQIRAPRCGIRSASSVRA